MNNNLRKLSKDLRSFAKRCKNVKFTSGLVLMYLLTGMISMTAVTDSDINAQRRSISNSISNMKQDFRRAKKENEKLLKSANLELIQLMEQGDQVVKSPWSSWQFGANYFYDEWNGTYKGRGDKKEKYPYEGIFVRSDDPYERYISPNSSMYSLLPTSTTPNSASSNNRQGLPNGYGLASTTPVREPLIAFEVSAGINPRTFTAPTVTPLTATQPNLPQAINFLPVEPNITLPSAVTVTPPVVRAPGTGNGDEAYIIDEDGTVLAGVNSSYRYVAPISQTSISDGTVDIVVTAPVGHAVNLNGFGGDYTLKTTGVVFKGYQNAGHQLMYTYTSDVDMSYSGNSSSTNTYAMFKLVGGHTIDLDNITINFSGAATAAPHAYAYRKWLLHTDGHNNRGESIWRINNGTNINMTGNYLTLYTSQYHSSTRQDANIGLINTGGVINSSGIGNIGWIGLSEGSNGAYGIDRIHYFANGANGTFNMSGENSIWSYIMVPTLSVTGPSGSGSGYLSNREGGFSVINEGTLTLSGNNSNGIILAGSGNANAGLYNNAEIMLISPMTLSGDNSNGIVFNVWAKLEGGNANFNTSTADNKDDGYTGFNADGTSRESVININLNGTNSRGVYFNYSGNERFNMNNYNIVSTNGQGNILVYANDGLVTLGTPTAAGGKNNLTITGGSGNTGLYSKTTDALNSAANITITDSDNSIGILATGSANVTNTGDLDVSGKSVKAIVSGQNGTIVNSTGSITVDGTETSATDGSSGIVASNGGTVTINPATGKTVSITVDGSASTGVYSGASSTINLTGGTVKTTGGAFNVFSSGTINLTDTTIDTGQSSLAFMSNSGGKIIFAGNNTATIAGGTTPAERGTAFLYAGSGYSSFTASDISTWAQNTFNNTLGNLTLNMGSGSRLFIASDVAMNLSDTGGSSLTGALGATINGTDYKTFMLYNSLLTLNQDVNLDNANDAYNQLELSNSSIDNNNNNNITGTQAGQTAIAQENLLPTRNSVTINNNGNINLSGANSTGIYTKFGIINNNATGTITVGDTSTGIYGVADTDINNAGAITIGNSSTGIFSDGSTTLGVMNTGNITGGTTSVGILYKPDSTIPAGAVVSNSGTITLGDSSVGMYGQNTATNYILSNSGDITVGNNGIAIFGYATDILGGTVKVGDKGVGVYSQSGNLNLVGGTIATGVGEAVGVYTIGSGQTITNSGTGFNLGNTSVAIANAGTGNSINSTVGNVSLGDNNIYIYSSDDTGTVTNSTSLAASGSGNYGIYSAGTVNSSGNMDFGAGIGNVGIYSIKGGTATNTGTITIGGTDAANNLYGIGMAAGYSTTDTGNIINNGTINVNGANSIGMYATGSGSTATNTANINLNADGAIGIYADNGATVNNSGNIQTGASTYTNVVGVYLGTGATLNNTGTITLDGPNAVGVYLKGGTIANYGSITVNGSSQQADTVQSFTTPPTSKTVGGVSIDAPQGAQSATITLNGIEQTPVVVNTFAQNPVAVSASSIGLYVNTSGKDYTNPINGLGNLTSEADLIIGMEATESTNSKYILINDPQILDPYNNVILNAGVSEWNIYGGSLTWLATPTLDPNDGSLTNIYMAKIPYTNWAGNEATPTNSRDTYNFLDGLEQRYGVDWYTDRGAREKELFNKLNSIGNNEEILLYQAIDEMMGHQYGNVQQRTVEISNKLTKEFDYLKDDWRNPSKQNNKIKAFGMRSQYKTDTAGIIDYNSKSYGVAYVHEDETIKLGNSTGWYAGYIFNQNDFKDIGKSKEKTNMIKAGVFKSTAFDDNGSLKWTISGDGYIGQNDMHRKYLVVDEIFNAKSTYYTYGVNVKNEISKDFRTSERTKVKLFGALDLGYGRFSTIKEDKGEVRLEVKSNDYYSIKPELGAEFRYEQPFAQKANFVASLGLGYETELGEVNDVNNKGKVRYTTADWFGIRGEKENRRGNGKVDLKLGIDNTRFGVTLNAGYDTNGEKFRGGIGFRAIY